MSGFVWVPFGCLIIPGSTVMNQRVALIEKNIADMNDDESVLGVYYCAVDSGNGVGSVCLRGVVSVEGSFGEPVLAARLARLRMKMRRSHVQYEFGRMERVKGMFEWVDEYVQMQQGLDGFSSILSMSVEIPALGDDSVRLYEDSVSGSGILVRRMEVLMEGYLRYMRYWSDRFDEYRDHKSKAVSMARGMIGNSYQYSEVDLAAGWQVVFEYLG